eukprot:1845734-Amphidinium_carterae.1
MHALGYSNEQSVSDLFREESRNWETFAPRLPAKTVQRRRRSAVPMTEDWLDIRGDFGLALATGCNQRLPKLGQTTLCSWFHWRAATKLDSARRAS